MVAARRPVDRTERAALIAAIEDAGDIGAAPGSRAWATAVRWQAHAALKDERSKARHLAVLLGLIREHKGHAVLSGGDGEPFVSFEAFCQAPMPFGLGYDLAAIERIIEERKSAEARAMRARPQAAPRPGEIGNGRGRGDNITSTGRGTNADYLAARIARDRPDILERMKAGGYPSVRAAAIEAGIVKVRWAAPTDPVALARAIRRRLAPAEFAEFAALIDELGADGRAP